MGIKVRSQRVIKRLTSNLNSQRSAKQSLMFLAAGLLRYIAGVSLFKKLSPPQRLPLGIPIKIAIIEKIESARGTMERGKYLISRVGWLWANDVSGPERSPQDSRCQSDMGIPAFWASPFLYP